MCAKVTHYIIEVLGGCVVVSRDRRMGLFLFLYSLLPADNNPYYVPPFCLTP